MWSLEYENLLFPHDFLTYSSMLNETNTIPPCIYITKLSNIKINFLTKDGGSRQHFDILEKFTSP